MNICVDAGFLIGLYDYKDEYHDQAVTHFTNLLGSSSNRLVTPWPILYETVSTRMARSRKGLMLFERDWRRLLRQQRIELLSDLPFGEGVVEECFEGLEMSRYRALSAADRVVRKMLADTGPRIDAFVTFNTFNAQILLTSAGNLALGSIPETKGM